MDGRAFVECDPYVHMADVVTHSITFGDPPTATTCFCCTANLVLQSLAADQFVSFNAQHRQPHKYYKLLHAKCVCECVRVWPGLSTPDWPVATHSAQRWRNTRILSTAMNDVRLTCMPFERNIHSFFMPNATGAFRARARTRALRYIRVSFHFTLITQSRHTPIDSWSHSRIDSKWCLSERRQHRSALWTKRARPEFTCNFPNGSDKQQFDKLRLVFVRDHVRLSKRDHQTSDDSFDARLPRWWGVELRQRDSTLHARKQSEMHRGNTRRPFLNVTCVRDERLAWGCDW